MGQKAPIGQMGYGPSPSRNPCRLRRVPLALPHAPKETFVASWGGLDRGHLPAGICADGGESVVTHHLRLLRGVRGHVGLPHSSRTLLRNRRYSGRLQQPV
jgi:hypothetical protein